MARYSPNNFSIFSLLLFLNIVLAQGRIERCSQKMMLLTGVRGVIQSPGYPNYAQNQLCIYQILLPKGYVIKLNFRTVKLGKSNTNCLKKDHIVLSSKMLHFQDMQKLDKKNQLILCGRHTPKQSILTKNNRMWIRFFTDNKKRRLETGFRITYSSVDRNECKTDSPCQHICTNVKGSFYCSCHEGYKLKNNLRDCKEVKEVEFLHHSYDVTVKFEKIELGEKILQLSARVKTVNGILRDTNQIIYLLEDDNDMFEIDRTSGILTFISEPEKAGKQRLVVKSKIDESEASCIVNINIVARNKLDKIFSVILQKQDHIGDTIFNLKPHYQSANSQVTFKSKLQNNYFDVKQNGKISIKSRLPEVLNTSTMYKTYFHVQVKVFNELGIESSGTATLSIILIPEFAGDKFITPEIFEQVAQDLKETEGSANNIKIQKNSKITFRTVGLHRLLRRPSKEAREISKAKRYFDEVIHRIQKRIKTNFLQGEKTGEPIIVHLGSGQIVSSSALEKLVHASGCKNARPVPDCTSFLFGSNYPPFDGACNNINKPLWGAASTSFKRLLPAQYYDVDGLSTPIGFPNLPEAPLLPTAHQVSQEFFQIHKEYRQSNSVTKYSHMIMQWGQFLDHDITMTAESEGGHHCVFPRCDNKDNDFEAPCFPMSYKPIDKGCSMFIRSAAVCQSNNVAIEARQQLNTITSYIDGSMVYGSSVERARELRTLDGTGLLRTTRHHYLPQVITTLTPPLSFCKEFGGCFDAGDVRVNEQVALTSMHTLWLREHNRIAKQLKFINKDWNGERVFLETRKIITAQIQHITFYEYLPKILGKNGLSKYRGYNAQVDASISNVFATAAFRFGHSLVQPKFQRLNSNFDKAAEDLPLVRAFFNNTMLLRDGIEPFLFGMVGNSSSNVDRHMAYGLARELFRRPGAVRGFDLGALNIQRGRDHGLPGYGRWREYCQQSKAYGFESLKDIIRNNKTREILRTLYNDQVMYADVFVAGLAEDHLPGAMVGPLFYCLLKEQFERLRSGDRYYYENNYVFTDQQLSEIRKTTLASVLCNNLHGAVSMQDDVFKVFTEGKGKRKLCNDIHHINLDKWKEFKEDDHVWSAWHETVRLPTGTWSVHQNLCGNGTIIDIECMTISNKSYATMTENVQCTIPLGVYCRNRDLADSSCSDYKVRMKCLKNPSVVEHKEKPIITGIPKVPIPAALQCKKAGDEDYAIAFPTYEEAVIENAFHTSTPEEYLHLGATKQYKKRILLKFNVERIKRTDAIHSATLQLYYVGHSQAISSEKHIGSTYLEAYVITSTNWNSTNVTSRVPWMGDYLTKGVDFDQKQLASVLITHHRPQWLHLNLYSAVRRWRLSSRELHRENFGIMLMIRTDNNPYVGMARIASSYHENITIRPRLLVCLSSAAW